MAIYTSSNTSLPSLRIEKAVGVAYRDQIVDLVTSRKKRSEMDHIGIRSSWPRYYDLWRGIWSGRFHPHKNNVHLPFIFSAILSDAARKSSTSLNLWPLVTFLGYGPDDMHVARKRESLVSAQMKDDNAFMKNIDFIVSSDLLGKAVMQVGWKRKTEKRIIEYIDKLPLSGRTVKHIKKAEITSFDGPCTELLDLLDFFPQPGVKNLWDMKWMVRRYFLDLDDVRYLASQGVFDQNEVNRLENEGGVQYASVEQATIVRRFSVRAGLDDDSLRYLDKYSRPIELLEYWGTIPSELSPDGVIMRKIVVANSRYLLANRPNPFWHNLPPFLDFSPQPDPYYFYSPGKAEVLEKLQIVGNRYINQSLDAADLIIDPMWFYDRASNLNTRNLYARPGRFIGVDGNPQAVIAPMETRLDSITVADSRIAQIREYIQMGSGIVDDAVQGLPGSDRQTAREFIGRREAAGTRLLLESRLYEEMFLEKLANMIVALDKQFLEMPVEVMILGEAALFDPVTGKPTVATRETMSDYDLVPNYQARAVGATSALSKSMKQERLIQLLQAMASPLGQVAMGSINAVNFFRGIFKEFEVPNINEIFMTNPSLQNAAQTATGGQGGLGQIPSSGQIVGGGALPLPATAPEQAGVLQGTATSTLPPM